MSQQDYDVASMTTQKRINVRQELTEFHDRLPQREDYSVSNTMVKQFVETAIYSLDAVQRLVNLADDLDEDAERGGGAAIVAKAIADEIRAALEGKR